MAPTSARWTAASSRLPAGAKRHVLTCDTDNRAEAMQAYLDWEFGLVAQLGRDGTQGFHVIQATTV